MTDEDDTRSLVRLEEALDGDLELASSLVGRDAEAEEPDGDCPLWISRACLHCAVDVRAKAELAA